MSSYFSLTYFFTRFSNLSVQVACCVCNLVVKGQTPCTKTSMNLSFYFIPVESEKKNINEQRNNQTGRTKVLHFIVVRIPGSKLAEAWFCNHASFVLFGILAQEVHIESY